MNRSNSSESYPSFMNKKSAASQLLGGHESIAYTNETEKGRLGGEGVQQGTFKAQPAAYAGRIIMN